MVHNDQLILFWAVMIKETFEGVFIQPVCLPLKCQPCNLSLPSALP